MKTEMKPTLKTIFLSILMLWSFSAKAQDYDSFLNGVLLDFQTKEPVVFATVRLKGKALGVISNNDGGFKRPSDFSGKGYTLEISSMGYNTEQIAFSSLKKNTINKIFLKPYTFELSETVVTAKKRRFLKKVNVNLKAEQIIKYAIERIKDNYDKNPFELAGYYRDYQLREKKYTNLNEAYIKVFDKGFEVEDHTSLQFGLYNYNTNLDFEVDSFAAKPYNYKVYDKYIPDVIFNKIKVSNELVQLFNHDAIRNNNEPTYSYVNTLVEDFIKKHDFFTYFLTNYGDKQVYKIKFKKDNVPFQVKGDIYIDVDTYAIRKLDYAVYRQKVDKASDTNYSESEMGLLYEILVEYKEYNDHMYLNYISFHNQFKLVRPPEFFIEDVIFDKNTLQMIMVLNKPAANWLQMDVKNFKVNYKGYRLKVDKVERVGYVGDTYALSFPRKGKLQRKRLNFLFSNIEDVDKASLVITVNKMVDTDGNLIAERKSELLDQFREFFTQKIIFGKNNDDDYMSYVNKKKSLGNPEQLKINTQIDEDFWMNTPLKKLLNKEPLN
jgi:hypothetical protein